MLKHPRNSSKLETWSYHFLNNVSHFINKYSHWANIPCFSTGETNLQTEKRKKSPNNKTIKAFKVFIIQFFQYVILFDLKMSWLY